MRRINPPQHIPLNVIDRQFLVPETDDFANGPYLPMTITAVVHPHIMPSVADLQEALIRVDNKFPQYRLGYTLDITAPRWIRIPDEERIEYLKGRVQKAEVNNVDDHLSIHIQHNLSPLEDPLKIIVCNDSICVHWYHPLGDARFLFQFTASLLTAHFTPERFEQSNDRFYIPLTEVVMSNIPQAMKVIGATAKRIIIKANNYLSGLSSPSVVSDSEKKYPYRAIISGTEMRVVHVEVPPQKMAQIRSVVHDMPSNIKISLNTYWQIYFAFRMKEMGLIDWPIELTTLVDLRRYVKVSQYFYPGNCISNIRLNINRASFIDACVDYQTQLTKQIKSAYPLSDIVGNWLLSLAGDKVYKQANRDWYLKASPKEKRFFTLTNVGQLDDMFGAVAEYITPDMRLVTPIMGSAPLVISFTSFDNNGHFTVTYKPDTLSMDNILQIIDF